MVTPPFFRLEGKQANTVRIFPNAYISKAPQDRETVYFFNVMSIPPTSDSEADKKAAARRSPQNAPNLSPSCHSGYEYYYEGKKSAVA